MNGLELSKGYFEEYGLPMLKNSFPELLPYIAAGLVGSGSERYGFDDGISKDHDFEPGFCIFLPGEDIVDRKQAFALERAYAKLPKEYGGVKRQSVLPVGGSRNGVIRTADFYRAAVGSPSGSLSVGEWLSIPDSALAEAVNGEVYIDNYGEFSAVRKKLCEMPEDIRLKRIAGNLMIMAQSGQYNYLRCIGHGEYEAAQFACNEFVNACLKTVFLLENRYLPYYKWSFRALKQTDTGKKTAPKLSGVLMGECDSEKYMLIEEIAADTVEMLQAKKLTKAVCGDLEKHAYSVNDRIKDSGIRNLSIFAAV